MNTAFLTGSHVYGVPRDESDVDLVVFVGDMPKSYLQILLDNCDEEGSGDSEDTRKITFRFGRLNLILCRTQAQYDAWRAGTSRLQVEMAINCKPCTRDRAVEVLKEERAARGIVGLGGGING